jgi:hypothetical protein
MLSSSAITTRIARAGERAEATQAAIVNVPMSNLHAQMRPRRITQDID